ncbi:hypothetical protein ACTVZO_45145 [Streptomyces sp. IBSNAI002]|uniref:hypothetical protein n=1 Tax=Streptomyces sp. IBSNAI002 TaxID=3457500 RepID=UPI003FCEED6F
MKTAALLAGASTVGALLLWAPVADAATAPPQANTSTARAAFGTSGLGAVQGKKYVLEHLVETTVPGKAGSIRVLALDGPPNVSSRPGEVFFLYDPSERSVTGSFWLSGDTAATEVDDWRQVKFSYPSRSQQRIEVRYGSLANPQTADVVASVTRSYDRKSDEPVLIDDAFTESEQGWKQFIADVPADSPLEDFELHYGLDQIPAPLDAMGRALHMTGHNRSDDLAMFATKEIGPQHGIKPNTNYRIDYDFDIATNAYSGVGIGGDPGGSVYVKAGAVSTQPATVREAGLLRANFDHGNQSEDGKDAVVLGNLIKPSGLEDDTYELKHFNNTDKPLSATSDSQGRLWLVVGTDSGYEGITHVYFPRIGATLTPLS